MTGRHRKPQTRIWPITLMPVGAGVAVLWQAPADPPPAPVVPEVKTVVLHQPDPTPVPVEKKVRTLVAHRIPPLTGAQGLRPTAARLAADIQAAYPEVTSIGGWRPDDGYHEHSNGTALDVMVDNPELGDRICADMLTRPDVKYVIWQQTIRYPSGYQRLMENRGTPTANHYNHVHIAVTP